MHAACKKDVDTDSSDGSRIKYCKDLLELEKKMHRRQSYRRGFQLTDGEPQHGRSEIILVGWPALAASNKPIEPLPVRNLKSTS